jgi:hypothetical protein
MEDSAAPEAGFLSIAFGRQSDAGACYVQQTPINDEVQPQTGGLLRSSGSCGSRLHTLNEDIVDSPFASAEPAHIPETSLRSVGSGVALSAMVAEDVHVMQSSLDGSPTLQPESSPEMLFPGIARSAPRSGLATGLTEHFHLNDMLGGNGIQVKNTFLDFEPRQKMAGLRAVHTYSGSLADLG